VSDRGPEATEPVAAGAALPVRAGHRGDAVRDIQQRLVRAGFDPAPDHLGAFDGGTEVAVRAFQQARSIRVDGICGRETWNALTDATWHLGDRLLYLCRPMLRGDDVNELQVRLGHLGFDAGRVDGIFGPDTARALIDFQRNTGLTTDGIMGPEVLAALDRLPSRGGTTTKAGVVEREQLRQAPRELANRRVLIAEHGELAGLADSLARAVRALGAQTLVCHHPDDSEQAQEANAFEAELFVALRLRDEVGVTVSYWSTTGYESVGGRRLAELIVSACRDELSIEPAVADGMRHTVLRETRMPAVVCELGPPAFAVTEAARVVEVLCGALRQWVAQPLDP
jgi:N-acetylmuramoyl-L-alanine amidase